MWSRVHSATCLCDCVVVVLWAETLTGQMSLCPQDEDSEAVLAADFEIGHFIRERIVPRAVLYFTGEAIEDDDDDVSAAEPLIGRSICDVNC